LRVATNLVIRTSR